jgi:integrase
MAATGSRVTSTRPTMSAAAAAEPRRLGAHHFACLRAVAEGGGVAEAATRYLAVEHALAAPAAYRAVLDQVRAVARRRGDSRWRLLGLELQPPPQPGADGQAPTPLRQAPPPLHAWAEAQGLGDWSTEELQCLYAERFGDEAAGAKRRQARNARLRDKRLQLLRQLEAAAAVPAAPTDLVEGWLPGELAQQLRGCGVLTLGDLRERIAQGGRWWRGLRAVGPIKAARLAQLLATLLGPDEAGAQARAWPVALAPAALDAFSGRRGSNRLTVPAGAGGIQADDDRQAIRAWIAARAGSPHTATQYERETERFLLWCVLERGRALSDASAEDCRAYMDFIGDVPARWISRRRVARLTPGWAPFKGPLSIASQQLAITVVASLFGWLVQARYLIGNPWVLVNRRLGDDALVDGDATSRAFTPAAWSALIDHLGQAAPSTSVARLRWICVFVQTVGLRSAELLRAQREHLCEKPAGWVIRVHGKGRRNRLVPVPRVAIEATRVYFASRGSSFDAAAPDTPLLASLEDGVSAITYQALHQTFTRFVERAIGGSRLSAAEREHALRASSHWLRHTYATRAAERGVPPDILQENLGQADPRTTARYYRAQMERRQGAMEKAFGEG